MRSFSHLRFLSYLRCYIVLFFSLTAQAQQVQRVKLTPANVRQIVKSMTLHEKASLVVGMYAWHTPTGTSNTGKMQGPAPVTVKVPGAAGMTVSIPALAIPAITFADGSSGLRMQAIRNNDTLKKYYATRFPSATLLASTWDTSLVKQAGAALGAEARDYGVDILLAPAINIQRNPLGGRNYEYYSEDPLLTGKIAAAMIKGIQSNGVGASLKHFAANNQETNRFFVNTMASERTLREIYLRGFEIAVKQGRPWTVMSSYNKINGTYTSESADLLTTILRKEWHFKGFVVTDWRGGKDPVAQMKAGNDLLMPGNASQVAAIEDAVNSGQLDIKILDANVTRILQVLVKTSSFQNLPYANTTDLRKHADLAARIAAEGCVLLKNDQDALPFTRTKKVALFGNASYNLILEPTTNLSADPAYLTTLPAGLSKAGYGHDQQVEKLYTDYRRFQPAELNRAPMSTPVSEMVVTPEQIKLAAKANDAAIITISRNSAKGGDRKLNDFYLTDAEKKMIGAVSKEFHYYGKKVTVLLNIPGPVEVATWRDLPDAILFIGMPGMKPGDAITSVLTGKVNPSGRLTSTFPVDYRDVPSSNFPGINEVTYNEGIYVGYRYYSTFHIKPAYPFGFGLSYTKFSWSKLHCSPTAVHGQILVTLDVKNMGKLAGRDVVEIYVSAPKGALDKPANELKAFAKTQLLKPGQSQHIVIYLNISDLASFDTATEAWVADAGTYKVKACTSADTSALSGNFTLPNTLINQKVNKALVPVNTVNELTPGTP